MAALLPLISSPRVLVIHSCILCGLISKYPAAQEINSLSVCVNLSTSRGQDSLKRLACESKRAPTAAIIKKVRNRVRIIAISRLIRSLTKKFTTGWRRIEIRMAKTNGIRIPCATYRMNSKPINPTIRITGFIYSGMFHSFPITGLIVFRSFKYTGCDGR